MAFRGSGRQWPIVYFVAMAYEWEEPMLFFDGMLRRRLFGLESVEGLEDDV